MQFRFRRNDIFNISAICPYDVIYEPLIKTNHGFISPIKLQRWMHEPLITQINIKKQEFDRHNNKIRIKNIKSDNQFFELLKNIDQIITENFETLFKLDNVKNYNYEPTIKHINDIEYIDIYIKRETIFPEIIDDRELKMIMNINHILFDENLKTYKLIIFYDDINYI